MSKRVACLYRVSTKQQVDEKGDLSMQKTECRNFIDRQQDWVLITEYYEKGVSGYKKSKSQRDVLLQIEQDAKDKKFDVLLVYMFDRLGRKEEETPFIMQDLVRTGIELWSTKEGEQRFDNHTDNLLSYIRSWQSAGESKKTSLRVYDSHRQLVENGKYRGGRTPYGYQTVMRNSVNKKGEPIPDLVINEEEAKIVKLMYELVYDKGYGSNRIQEYLIEKQSKTRSGKLWDRTAIGRILSNPIYKGYMTYGKLDNDKHMNKRENWILSKEANPELIIVSEDVWEKVQQIRSEKSPTRKKELNDEKYGDKLTRKIGNTSPLLLIGFIRCGHCKNIISTSYNYAKWTRKSGETFSYGKPVYRCNGRVNKTIKCDGQTTYRKDKIENIVIKQTKNFISNLESRDFSSLISKMKKDNLNKNERKLNDIKNEKEKLYLDIKLLNDEVMKILKGESNFTAEMINQIKNEKENKIKEINEEITIYNEKIKQAHLEIEDIVHLKRHVVDWGINFDNADDDQKKILLSRVIDTVWVYKNKITIDFKIHIKNFADSKDLHKYESNGKESYRYSNTIVKLFEETISIDYNEVI